MRTVAAYRDAPAAYIAASALEAEDVPYEIHDEHTVGVNWLWSQAVGGVKLRVPEPFVDKALALLREDRSGLLSDSSDRNCPTCGSSHVRSSRLRRIAFSLSLISGVPIIAWSRRWRCMTCGHRWIPDATAA